MKAISDLIEKYARDIFDNKKIGILYPNNELVIKTCQRLKDNGTPCEFKYNAPDSQKSIDTLDFETYLPKIMTYHSAKGLQFDVVILPMYEGANDNESRKALYVAMTRTMHHLYVLYSTPTIEIPLSDVPTKLYLKTL
jgi:ATP-dependent exoDNAse (exonuclease V) beta subunit